MHNRQRHSRRAAHRAAPHRRATRAKRRRQCCARGSLHPGCRTIGRRCRLHSPRSIIIIPRPFLTALTLPSLIPFFFVSSSAGIVSLARACNPHPRLSSFKPPRRPQPSHISPLIAPSWSSAPFKAPGKPLAVRSRSTGSPPSQRGRRGFAGGERLTLLLLSLFLHALGSSTFSYRTTTRPVGPFFCKPVSLRVCVIPISGARARALHRPRSLCCCPRGWTSYCCCIRRDSD